MGYSECFARVRSYPFNIGRSSFWHLHISRCWYSRVYGAGEARGECSRCGLCRVDRLDGLDPRIKCRTWRTSRWLRAGIGMRHEPLSYESVFHSCCRHLDIPDATPPDPVCSDESADEHDAGDDR